MRSIVAKNGGKAGIVREMWEKVENALMRKHALKCGPHKPTPPPSPRVPASATQKAADWMDQSRLPPPHRINPVQNALFKWRSIERGGKGAWKLWEKIC